MNPASSAGGSRINPARVTVDLDDTEGLLEADYGGLLRASAMAGAQVRAIAADIDEGALHSLAAIQRPRSVIWVAGHGCAGTAGAMLAAVLGDSVRQPIVLAAQCPSWIGPLDVVVVAGFDPGDPVLVNAASVAVRRGAQVVIVAPYEGPLRDVAAGRAAVLAPRLGISDDISVCRYMAAGLAVLHAVDPMVEVDIAALADQLDAEALCNGVSRAVVTNPAKVVAQRISDGPVVLAGACAATVILARHATQVLVRLAYDVVAAAGIDDVVVGLHRVADPQRGRTGRFSSSVDALFHDEQIDEPLVRQPRVLVLALAADRPIVATRIAGLNEIDVMSVDDDVDGAAVATLGRAEHQLAVLALRCEMAAVYRELVSG